MSVDVTTWSPIWDISAIAKTDVDYIMTMGTYTANTTTFLKQLDSMVAQIPLTKLVVGLECDENDVGKLSKEDLDTRFAAIKTSGAQGIALWRMPVPHHHHHWYCAACLELARALRWASPRLNLPRVSSLLAKAELKTKSQVATSVEAVFFQRCRVCG